MNRTTLLATATAATLGALSLQSNAQTENPSSDKIGAARIERVYKKVSTEKGERELKLFITNPPDWKPSDRRGAIVFFHGGGWKGGFAAQFNEQSRYLATRGLVCIQAQYRTIGNAVIPPLVCVYDAKSALRWVRAHAPELGVNPDRIAAGGGSAGGHLAAFAGLVEGLDDPGDDLAVSPKPRALLLFNPVLDNGPNGGYGYERIGARYREFSPAHNVSPGAPPTLVMLGTNDNLIPVETMRRFQSNMERVGARCDLTLYEGAPHGFFNQQPYRDQTVIECDKFLASLGWLQGPPTLEVDEKQGAP